MNLFKTFALSLATLGLIFSINCTRIEPGHVGIEVNLSGTNRGVQDFPVRTGRVWYNPIGTDIIEYPVFVQTAVWTRDPKEGSENNEEISFNSRDGMVFTADISLSYHLQAEKAPAFYLKFKSDNINHFTHGMLRQVARDEFNNVAPNYTAEELYSTKKEELTKEVQRRLNARFQDVGMVVESIGFIGASRPPASFIAAVNSKLEATQNAQRAENEVKQTKAEAEKEVARAQGDSAARIARAEGETKANQLLASSITQGLIQWRQLELQHEYLNRWNGQLPQITSSGNSGMLFQVNPNHQQDNSK